MTLEVVEVHPVYIEERSVTVVETSEVQVVFGGEQGPSGPPPAHEWDGTKLRFQNPDGTWGDWTELLPDVADLVQAFQNALI